MKDKKQDYYKIWRRGEHDHDNAIEHFTSFPTFYYAADALRVFSLRALLEYDVAHVVGEEIVSECTAVEVLWNYRFLGRKEFPSKKHGCWIDTGEMPDSHELRS